MGCNGLHCDGCGGSGGPAAAAIALLVFIAVGLRAVWPKVVHVLEIIGWTLAAASGAVIVAAGTVVTVRVIRSRRARIQNTTTAFPSAATRIVPAVRVTVLPSRPAGVRPVPAAPRRPQLAQPRPAAPARPARRGARP